MTPLYDRIGSGYPRYRRPDARLVKRLIEALGPTVRAVVDVGAGTGKYARALASAGLRVTAVEPSSRMLEQAALHPGVTYLAGTAEALPLATASADAAICVIAMSHFPDVDLALREMDRITSRGTIVNVTIDPRVAEPYWFPDYFPEVAAANLARSEPIGALEARFRRVLGRSVTTSVIPIPADFEDLFTGAAWSRPELYLEESFRRSAASFALAPATSTEAAVRRLERDLVSGAFAQRYPALRQRTAWDVGLRLMRVAPTSE
ncbi:MAG: class I SAM-dependent methyltransferase [Polyangiaceae bacterium]|nr:class I SAM-dependent methyltransferase [Polyangiaceae bacterium]